MMTTQRHPFTVRQTKSGYNGNVKYLVFKNGQRVSVVAHYSREGAQMEADDLNIGAMVKDYADDPRPYEVRLAEAKAAYTR